MNRPRLSKSGIEYLDCSWGIFSGCRNHQNGICAVGKHCWARPLPVRFPARYPDGFNPHFYPEALDSPKRLRRPSRIGVGWVGDIIGYGLQWREQILSTIEQCPQHTFLFLTKNPANLVNWSPFPANCHVGVSITADGDMTNAYYGLAQIEAGVRYVSCEPLLGAITMKSHRILETVDWVALGSQTRPYHPPEIPWVQEIVEACDRAGTKVFLKENLWPLLYQERDGHWGLPKWAANSSGNLRQELPA